LYICDITLLSYREEKGDRGSVGDDEGTRTTKEGTDEVDWFQVEGQTVNL